MGAKCFFVKDSGKQRVSLRRYQYSSVAVCPKTGFYHNASAFFADVPEVLSESNTVNAVDQLPKEDSRWQQVAKCEACGYIFTEQDPYQMFQETLYVDANGKEWVIPRDTKATQAAGLMWDAWWFRHKKEPGEPNTYMLGPDGLSLHVITPDGWPWCIDSRASNCDSPCRNCGQPYFRHYNKETHAQNLGHHFEESRPHKCWVRQGVPPMITVGKGGITCGAGAGSILSGNGYHGFLQNGSFT